MYSRTKCIVFKSIKMVFFSLLFPSRRGNSAFSGCPEAPFAGRQWRSKSNTFLLYYQPNLPFNFRYYSDVILTLKSPGHITIKNSSEITEGKNDNNTFHESVTLWNVSVTLLKFITCLSTSYNVHAYPLLCSWCSQSLSSVPNDLMSS